MHIMQRPHAPTLLGAVVVGIVLLLLYHLMFGRRRY